MTEKSRNKERKNPSISELELIHQHRKEDQDDVLIHSPTSHMPIRLYY